MWRTFASIVVLLLVGCPVEAPDMAYTDTHGRYCQLDIPAAWFDSALSDFPVLYTTANLPSEMFDADGSYPARSDGADVRFSTDSAGTVPLNREIVTFGIDNNPANGTAEIWVQVPSCSASVATTIYVWYNDPDASEPSASDASEGSQGVWDSDYEIVLHLQEAVNNDPDGYKDSTSNAHHMTGVSMANSPVAAPWGGGGLAGSFDGSADYLERAESIITAYPYSMSGWVNSDNVNSVRAVAGVANSASGTDYGYLILSGNVTGDPASFAQSGLTGRVDTTSGYTASTWYHVACEAPAIDSQYVWLNGGSEGSGSTSRTFGSYDLTSIGRLSDNTPSAYFAGGLDEIRMSSVNRGVAWFKAEYSTTDSPGDITVGTPASPAAGTGPELESLFTPAFRRPILAGFYG